MEKLECPQCGIPLGNGVTVCGECGKEVVNSQEQSPADEPQHSDKRIYGILAVFLVVVGGVALLLFTGIVPNPFKVGSAAAIVNGEKISLEELDQKVEIYKKIYGQSTKTDFSSPEGKKALADMKRQVLNALIQEKILVTEAVREKITVSPEDIKAKIGAIKKAMNLSDKDFEEFLKNHTMNLASFEKRVEKEELITRLIAKGTQEKGLTKEAWINSLQSRARVEILTK